MSGPTVWGPHGWKFIHYVTIGYPPLPTEEVKKKYLDFFNSLQHVIPCSICGNNYRNHIKEYPLTNKILSNKSDFIAWGILMHNLVNLSNNKPEYNNTDGLKEIIKNCTGDCPGKTDISIDNSIDNSIDTSNTPNITPSKELFNYNSILNSTSRQSGNNNNYYKYIIFILIVIIIILILYITLLSKK